MSAPIESARTSLLPDALELYQRSFYRCWPLSLAGAVTGALAGFYAALRVQQLMAAGHALLSSALNAPQDASNFGLPDVSSLQTLLTQMQSLVTATLRPPAVWLSYLGAALITLSFHGLLVHEQSMLDAQTPGGGVVRRPASVLLPGMLLAALLLVIANALASYVAGVLMTHNHAVLLIGLLLLVTWLWGCLQLWLVAMFSEDRGALDAFRHSWKAVSGHWWYASAATTLPYILIFLASALASLVAGRVGLPAGASSVALVQGLQAAVAVFTLPLLPAWWLVLYRGLQSAGQSQRPG